MVLFQICKFLLAPLVKLIFSLKCEGAHNVPKNSRVILACNHQSAIDPALLAVCLHRPFYAMAKEELFNRRAAAFMLKKFGAFPVHRGVADMSSIDYAVSVLRQGNAFLIFPQGTRHRDDKITRLKSGVVAISAMAQAPVVPVIINAPHGIKPFRKVSVRFGEPIQYYEFNITEFRSKQFQAAKALLLGRMLELQEQQ